MGPSSRRYGQQVLQLAEELADRAAVFLDNARLYQDIQEADARKNEFLAMLAHELRNPLAAIRNAVQVLGLSDMAESQRSWARAIIDRQVTQLVRLVDDLLDVARITQGKIRLQMESVDLTAVVDLAVELSSPLIKARHHQLLVSCKKDPLWIKGDSTRLAQVLANLLNNAAKYTDPGGQIWLTVERVQDHVVVRVRDNGIGIPAQMLGSIFDLFTQVDRALDRSQGGLGIGLTLVRALVEMHGGKVSATSSGPGQGSEFVVQLPLLPDQATQQAGSGGGRAGDGPGGRRVLVVEDNRDIAESLALLLTHSGHEVRTVHDGRSALDAAREFRPHVVLLDIGLPELDGYEVARRLRQFPELVGARLVALTGYGQPAERRRAMEAGFDVHLVKPVDLLALKELLDRMAAGDLPGGR
jgi:CheY-like chemotaxis protein